MIIFSESLISERCAKKTRRRFFLLFFFQKSAFSPQTEEEEAFLTRAHTRTRTATGVKLKKDSAGKKRFEYYFLREIRGWISKKRVRGFHAHVR